ncbi:MAG: hypothetical protein L0191_08855 [Acidobacteria bacterium]|nr:hypothetical protein [Acidobacteriota bacterium]
MLAFNPLTRQWTKLSGLERRALDGDWFIDRRCVVCGCHGAAFSLVPDGRIICTCPACVVARIEQIEAEFHKIPVSLPLALRILRAEALGEADRQRRRDRLW